VAQKFEYEVNGSIFYFLMIDPSLVDDEEIRLIAITFDENRKIESINNFKFEEDQYKNKN